MDHQDWTVVTMKRLPKKDAGTSYSFTNHSLTGYPSTFHHGGYHPPKVDALDITYVPKKCITADSLQALIRKRLEMKLNQEKADQLCAFPVNTFKNLEARRLVPMEKHQMVIQRHLGIQLKIDV